MSTLSICTIHASEVHGPRDTIYHAVLEAERFKVGKVCQRNEELTAQVERLTQQLADAEARISAMAGKLTAAALTAQPNDSLTLTYWRAWYDTLSADERQAMPAVVRDLAQPWCKRGTAWQALVRRVQQAGAHGTPPGKLDSKPGQGAPESAVSAAVAARGG